MNLPELDLDVDAPDAFAVLAGVMIIDVGKEMSGAREPSIFWGVASVYVFAAAILLLVAGLTSIDVSRWGRPLAGFAVMAVLVAAGMTWIMTRHTPIFTDTLGFLTQAADSVLQLESPYTQQFTLGELFPTPSVDGGHVERFSYPLGSALWAAPFVALFPAGGRVAVLVGGAMVGALIVWYAPHDLAPLAVVALLAGDFVIYGVNDLTDPLFVAPLVGALFVWPWSQTSPDSLTWSAILFGVAMTMKQQAWFCAPFLLLWVLHERDLRAGLRYTAIVAGVFALVHLPSFVVAPSATVEGLLVNLTGGGKTIVHLGVGLAALTLSGAFPIAKSFHTILMGLAGLGLVGAYWHWFDRLKWLAWIAWGPLLFFNYRSLANYFVVLAPMAVAILIAQYGRDAEVVGSD
jgi:uncharacterized membrane protein